MLTTIANKSLDVNSLDDFGSLFYVRSQQTSVVSRNNDIKNCSQNAMGGVFRIDSIKTSEFTESLSNYSMVYANAGGIVYCKNCYKVDFRPYKITKIAALRGGAIALQSDVNCNYRGTQDVTIANFTFQDSISLYDGGGLLYSRSDCYLDLEIINLMTNNSRATFLTG
jgi:hypothetical protein